MNDAKQEELIKPERYLRASNGAEVECIDAIRAALTPEEWRGFLKGTVMRYVWRERQKGGEADCLKSLYYSKWLAGIDPRDYDKAPS